MTFTVISSAVNAPVTLDSNSTLLLTAFGSIIPAAGIGPAINRALNTSSGITIVVDGLVAAFRDDAGPRIAILLSSANASADGLGGNNVSIGASGVIRASGIGVEFLGHGNTFANFGFIDASSGVGASGANGVFINGGTVQADYCFSLGGQSLKFSNSGSLFGTFTGAVVSGNYADVRNSGAIEAGNYGISVEGDFASVGNTGQIAATNLLGIGLRIISQNASVTNTGSVFGAQTGVEYLVGAEGSGNLGLTNSASGAISGDNYGVSFGPIANLLPNTVARIDNLGTITANSAAVLVLNMTTVVLNAGSIVAANGPAILADSNLAIRVVNTGTIASLLPANGSTVVAIDLGGSLDGGTSELRNFGSVLGDVLMSDGVSTVRNGGLMDGDVFLDLGDDTFVGRNGTVSGTVFGEGGKDTLRGGADDDRFSGGDANDVLLGNGGDDVLGGGTGLDVMTGGTGTDLFVFKKASEAGIGPNADHITDFASGQDIIDLGFLAEGKFIGSGPFSNSAGQVRYTIATGLIECDTDGNGSANFSLVLDNRSNLTAADFLL